jgi:hypothetical protein
MSEDKRQKIGNRAVEIFRDKHRGLKSRRPKSYAKTAPSAIRRL